MTPHISFRLFRLAFFTVIVVLIVSLAGGAVEAQETKTAKSEDAPQEKVEPVPGLAELIKKASNLKVRLRALEKGLSKASDITGFEEKLTGLQTEIGELQTDLEKVKESESYSYDHLVECTSSDPLGQVRHFVNRHLP